MFVHIVYTRNSYNTHILCFQAWKTVIFVDRHLRSPVMTKTWYRASASSSLSAEQSFCQIPDSISSTEGEDGLGWAGSIREDQEEVSHQSRN